jgi:arginyl-tRNA synthetase
VRDRLDQLVRAALKTLAASEDIPALAELDPGLERARDVQHGDFASNVAMQGTKLAGMSPRDLARAIIDCLPADPLIAATEIAGPGFINIRLATSAWHTILRDILARQADFGTEPADSRGRVLIEYLSANPTGPLHVGHGRHAAFGASLAAILRAAGYEVDEEYYVNDAGRQMDILAASVWLRYAEEHGSEIPFPAKCYQGDYVREIARELTVKHGEALLGNPETVAAAAAGFGEDEERDLDTLIAAIKSAVGASGFAAVFDSTLEAVLGDIENDLEEFGAAPGQWFSEQSLIDDNAVQAAIDRLADSGFLYEKDGPTWFRTTDFGDDKDRVVVRDNGVTTYFASDIAYHINKFERGYDYLINVLGADHHGYVPRLKAAVAASGNDPERLEFRLVQFVVLFRGSEKVQMTTRGGRYVTLRELRAEVGNDAARFFYVSRSNDQHLDFDLELAKQQTADNPVYYIQYAHARVASMLDKLGEALPDPGAVDFSQLEAEAEINLMRSLSRYPEIVELAAKARAPQHVAHYLRDLAAQFHAYYNAHRVLVDETALRSARILLAVATQQVIRNGLGLLGVSAPESM